LTGPINKSRWVERRAFLHERPPEQPVSMLERAAGSEDSFDAAVSALVVATHADQLAALTPTRDPYYAIEGRIWRPRSRHSLWTPRRRRSERVDELLPGIIDNVRSPRRARCFASVLRRLREPSGGNGWGCQARLKSHPLSPVEKSPPLGGKPPETVFERNQLRLSTPEIGRCALVCAPVRAHCNLRVCRPERRQVLPDDAPQHLAVETPRARAGSWR
jgi:hypothetical protein